MNPILEFFTGELRGEPFYPFSQGHLVLLAIMALLIVAMVWYYRRHPEHRQAFRYAMGTLLLLDQLGWQLWVAVTGQWAIQSMLPFHLCSVFAYLSAYMLFTKNYRVYELAYFLGIGGALQAILTPETNNYPLLHYRIFQALFSHGLIVAAAIYMTLVEGYRPTWRSILRMVVIINLYMLFVGLVNWAIGSNYLYIAHKPDVATALDLLGPWPWYILGMEAVGVVMSLILYLPFAIRDWLASRKGVEMASTSG